MTQSAQRAAQATVRTAVATHPGPGWILESSTGRITRPERADGALHTP